MSSYKEQIIFVKRDGMGEWAKYPNLKFALGSELISSIYPNKGNAGEILEVLRTEVAQSIANPLFPIFECAPTLDVAGTVLTAFTSLVQTTGPTSREVLKTLFAEVLANKQRIRGAFAIDDFDETVISKLFQ